jgi:hypothetical protein
MSTKLNAEELAAKRFPEYDPDISPSEAYEEAVRYIAQPIADERDEFRKQVEEIVRVYEEGDYGRTLRWEIDSAKKLLAKYPKP